MITLFQRWTLLIVIGLINAELFDMIDWQFWIIAILSGMVCSPLYKKEIE